jgi:ParB family chromosome partitioning protein
LEEDDRGKRPEGRPRIQGGMRNRIEEGSRMNAVFSKNLGSLLDDVDGKVVRRISVDLIDRDPHQPRTEFSDASIEEMGTSLAAEGQMQPVELIEQVSGRFILVFGERRWRGAKWKGIAELDAIVHPKGMDAKTIRRRQLIENLQREDMSARDTANAIAQLVKQEGSAAAAGRAIGKSEAQISKYMSLLNLPPIAAELASTSVTRDVETLTTVAKIERDDPHAAQQLVTEAKTTGKLSRGRARDVAQAVNDALKEKRNTRALFEGKGAAVKPAAPKAAPAKSAAAGDAPAPVRMKAGEALSISVKVVETHREAKRFNKAAAEHGDPQLYQGGVSRNPDRCWVLFGDSSRAKKTDDTPRLQEFACNAIVLGTVTKYQPEA